MAAAPFDSTSLPGDIRLMNATADVLTALGVAVLVAVLALWLMKQPIFALRDIRIEGEVSRNSVSTIRANAVPRLAGNFFTLDLATGRRAFESVPWVRVAELRRIWPNQLAVRLEEHRPVAFWGGTDPESDKLVDTFGEVFEANLGDVEDDGLPTLSGPDGSAPHLLEMHRRLGPAFAPLKAAAVALELSGRGSWRVELSSGAVVEIGRGTDDELVARVERFVATLGQVTSLYQRPLEYADLRHNDGYAVRLRGITTTLDAGARPAAKN